MTALFVLIGGCANMTAPNEPNASQLAAATYPNPIPPSKFESAIKEWASDNLVDPESLRIRGVDSEPAKKGWIAVCTHWNGYGCSDRMFYFGHLFNARINAKNKQGGYTGFTDYIFVIRGDEISYGTKSENITNRYIFK